MSERTSGEIKSPRRESTLLENCLAEGRWMLLFWLACFVWVIAVSLYLGRGDASGKVETIGGVPAWVFWGVGLPWLAATAFSGWFAMTRMADDSLESEGEIAEQDDSASRP